MRMKIEEDWDLDEDEDLDENEGVKRRMMMTWIKMKTVEENGDLGED